VISLGFFIKDHGKMALKMGKDRKISKINKNMMEDGQQAKRKDTESYFILMEVIIKEIFLIIK
jgi:hypothetical protein